METGKSGGAIKTVNSVQMKSQVSGPHSKQMMIQDNHLETQMKTTSQS